MDTLRAFFFPPRTPSIFTTICSEFATLSVKQPAKIIEWVRSTFRCVKAIETLVHDLRTCQVFALLVSCKGYQITFTFSLFNPMTERLRHKMVNVRPIKIPPGMATNEESTPLCPFDPEDFSSYKVSLING